MNENPYQSPQEEAPNQQVVTNTGYPQTILVAQLCGVLTAALQFTESVANGETAPFYSWFLMVLAVASFTATAVLAIADSLTWFVALGYFLFIAWMSLIVFGAILVDQDRTITLHTAPLTLILAMMIALLTRRPSAQEYYYHSL
ncbi:hypothetical protein [Blastopirellula marina]|uniref:Uncharacterized protein n=1 Tax=Blastopirellula marina TaxID=124 RepID=A0A2S8FWS6_9BACT|nr:hypothetical protein [Blastopirellula marina]PQO36625.1 hypothetical protein C5Y98_11560 [Blastopirellula marina]PTL44455.1 hypothetical protein C5Y97_11570 [Blastopirellula marina]